MIKTFKALSALLSYPDAQLQRAAGELRDGLRAERLLPAKHNAALTNFIDKIERQDLYELQAHYVALFDRTRSLSLHLFEHVHGDSRARGQALIDLLGLYQRHGLHIDARELPDYLPLFLEFLSTLRLNEAKDILNQPLQILMALRQRLEKNGSDYAALLAALEALATGRSTVANTAGELFSAHDPAVDNLDALDREWEERAVLFAPANSATAAHANVNAEPGRVYVKPPGARPNPTAPAAAAPHPTE